MSTFCYPSIKRDETIIDVIHGTPVHDPYRHLEEAHSNETREYVKAQNEVTDKYLKTCPYREAIRERLHNNQNFVKIGTTFKRANKYYYFKNSGLQNQSVLYQQSSLDSDEKVFFDPNLLSDDGTVALTHTSFSKDGKWLAYGISYGGSDWVEISIRNLDTNQDLPEKLTRVKFTSIEWTHDSKGFFYNYYPNTQGDVVGNNAETNENQQLHYHVLNSDQSKDFLKVSFDENPKWLINFQVSDDGKTLHVFPADGCDNNLWYYADLENSTLSEKLKLNKIYDKFEASISYLSNNGDTVYFKTNLNASNYKICKLHLKQPQVENWIDVVPNHDHDVLDSAEIYTVSGKDYLLINYLRSVVYYLEIHELEGKLLKAIKTPPGTISKYAGYRYDEEIFYQFTSFLTPGQSFHLNLNDLDHEPTLLRQSKPNNFNPNDYVIKQVFYDSNDGVKVPMFVVHKKNIVLDGKNPCILYGYGGFSHQITSSFNINRVFWLQNMNGVFAVANIRGGGEHGKKWHDSGRLLEKQQSFNDFISAGEYLVKNKYTSIERLAIEGGSNGGFLVAAVSNQRPDLFGATICHVGVLDLVRYHKFTIGYAWKTEYGDPDDKVHFNNLLKLSPYHNIPNNTDKYPATLVLTAEFDDRVVAAHSLKFVSQLQHTLSERLPNTPFLLRVDTKTGHGGGRSLTKLIDEYRDIYSFLYNSLHLEDYLKLE